MASHRNTASRSAPEHAASAEALLRGTGEGLQRNTATEGAQPRAGRTGKVGAKAERPAENRSQKTGSGAPEPTRGGKAPSPAAKGSASLSGGAKGRARNQRA